MKRSSHTSNTLKNWKVIARRNRLILSNLLSKQVYPTSHKMTNYWIRPSQNKTRSRSKKNKMRISKTSRRLMNKRNRFYRCHTKIRTRWKASLSHQCKEPARWKKLWRISKSLSLKSLLNLLNLCHRECTRNIKKNEHMKDSCTKS